MADISVIIPCYNVEGLIDRLMKSLLAQTIGFERLEVILVDDCSTDNTRQIIKDWEKKYTNNILVVECEENRRQGAARNIGLQYASAEYIGYIDSDDWVEPDYFEKLYKIAIEGDYECVSCQSVRDSSKGYALFDNTDTGREDKVVLINNDEERKSIIVLPPLGYAAWGKIVKKSFLINNNLFFPEDLTYEDAGWGSLFHLYVKKGYVLEKNLYHYYVNSNSTVLTTNSNHHIDCFTVQMWVWEEYKKRGFLDKFREELEMEHIFSFYLAGIKAIILRYEKPDYNAYLLLRTIMLEHVPNYIANKYVKEGRLNDFYLLIMESLKYQLSKNAFLEMAENIKKIGI